MVMPCSRSAGQQAQVDGLAGGPLFQGVELVGQDRARIEQQAADQGAFAVVDAAGGQEAQRAVVGAGGRARELVQDSTHQK
jgi:hypothetical protein